MKPNMTNNENLANEYFCPACDPQPFGMGTEVFEALAEKQREELFAMIRSLSFQRSVRMIQILLDIHEEVVDHLHDLAEQHEDGDVSIYIPKGMVDAAGLSIGDPIDIEMDEDGLYISKAKEIEEPDPLFAQFLSFLDLMEAEDEE